MSISQPSLPSTTHLTTVNHQHVVNSLSTNSELMQAIQSGQLSVDGTHLLTADTQTAGRGQHGRSWQSPKGNVYLSLYHPISVPITGLLSLMVGYELQQMPLIQSLNQQRVKHGLMPIGVKWANDIGFYTDIANEHGVLMFQKLAGILIEPVWQLGKLLGVIIGVGLNVSNTPILNQSTQEGMSYQAISLADLDCTNNQPSLDMLDIYQQITDALLLAVSRLIDCHTKESVLDKRFVQQFTQVDVLLGKKLKIYQTHINNQQILSGMAEGIDTSGCLLLRTPDDIQQKIFTGRIEVVLNH